MKLPRFLSAGAGGFVLLVIVAAPPAAGQEPSGRRISPNLAGNIGRPLRYRPEGADFVIENGAEFFNRSLYGGDTAFRVDGGDKPEFVLYLPGRGGNLRLAIRSVEGAKWLHDAEHVVTRYRPGQLLYEVRDPLLGPNGVLRVDALAYDQTEGLVVRVTAENTEPGLELAWAYGGVNGQRGARDGDIGTERVPISQYFQLQPEFCRGNKLHIGDGCFTLTAEAATIAGVVPPNSSLAAADARQWNDLHALLAPAPSPQPELAVLVGRAPLADGQTLMLSLQRIAGGAGVAADLNTYREVTAGSPDKGAAPATPALDPAYAASDLPGHFEEARAHFAALRARVSVDTPDAYLNAAMGALNVAADALWDEPQQAIMHGAIAWRTRLLGWRGPYALDDLGWHDRARINATYWAARQNMDPIPANVPAPSEATNLARNEEGLHSNGDISNSHYDMNLVYIDALFRHLLWTGDEEFAVRMWPVIVRHLAWERRLFRRQYGPDKLPLYEAYAAIWASDNLQYDGGGTAHASAYNYYHNKMAARIAPLAGADPAPYALESARIARAMRTLLWQPESGEFAEYKDLLGLQLVHPSAALWTFYHTIDSEVPTPAEAWQMAAQVDRDIPHLPVAGPGVPDGLHTLATSDWMPYQWSTNNVVMAEAMHAALGFWQAGRPEEAWRITKGSMMAAMFMGISPGNVGTMSYLDVYRRESQRDFGDGAGVMSRAIVEGLFGVRPDALAGVLLLAPGFPAVWDHAALRHPDLSFSFRRSGNRDTYVVEPKFARPQRLRLLLTPPLHEVLAVEVNGRPAPWQLLSAPGAPERVEIAAPCADRTEINVTWSGAPAAAEPAPPAQETPPPSAPGLQPPLAGAILEAVDLVPYFNDQVTRIFRNEYRSPRSPFVSLELPKQGIGGWAGAYNATADIDDSGLRAAAARNGGRLVLPNGVPLATPGDLNSKNILFTSRWDNYPAEAVIPLTGCASQVYLMMAGSTNPMQSRLDNGEVIVTYQDGTTERLALENPTTWWPIEQDYFADDFQFRLSGPLPARVDLKTGSVRVLRAGSFKGAGGGITGGAATVLTLPLNPWKKLQSLTMRTLANDVVIGLMSATLVRAQDAAVPEPALPGWVSDVGARLTPSGPGVFEANAYGAVGDGATPATPAIQGAIDACASAGGGLVIFRPGTYLCGALFIKSRVHVRVDEGVTLLATTDESAYPIIATRIAGIEMPWPAALINVNGQQDVEISGGGTIDGQGEVWWKKYWALRKSYEPRGIRWAADYDCERVRLLVAFDSKDVTVSGLRLRRSGFWTVQITYCDRVTVDGVRIMDNAVMDGVKGPSTDGVDIDSSRRVLVQRCDIDNNDDDICLKAGRDYDGLRVNRPTEYVVVRDNTIRRGGGVISFGSETSGGIRHVVAYRNVGIGTSEGVRFKSVRTRGGTVEDILIRDLVLTGVALPFTFNLDWNPQYSYARIPPGMKDVPSYWKVLATPVEPPERGFVNFGGITIESVTATGARQIITASGMAEKPLGSAHWENVSAQGLKAGEISDARDWTMKNVHFATGDGNPVKLVNCQDVESPSVTRAN
jgi:hypothetical protein